MTEVEDGLGLVVAGNLDAVDAGVNHAHPYIGLGLATGLVGGFHLEQAGCSEVGGIGVGRSGILRVGSLLPSIGEGRGAALCIGMKRGLRVLVDNGVGPCVERDGGVNLDNQAVGHFLFIGAGLCGGLHHSLEQIAVGNAVAVERERGTALPYEQTVQVPFVEVAVFEAAVEPEGGRGLIVAHYARILQAGGEGAARSVHLERVGQTVERIAIHIQRGIGNEYHAVEGVVHGGLGVADKQARVFGLIGAARGNIAPRVAVVGAYLPDALRVAGTRAAHGDAEADAVAFADFIARNRTLSLDVVAFGEVDVERIVARATVAVGGVEIAVARMFGRKLRVERVGGLRLRNPTIGHGVIQTAQNHAAQLYIATEIHNLVGTGLHNGSGVDGNANRVAMNKLQTVAFFIRAQLNHSIQFVAVSKRGGLVTQRGGALREVAVQIPIHTGGQMGVAGHHHGKGGLVEETERETGLGQNAGRLGRGLFEARRYTVAHSRVVALVESAEVVDHIRFGKDYIALLQVVGIVGVVGSARHHLAAVAIPVVAQVGGADTGGSRYSGGEGVAGTRAERVGRVDRHHQRRIGVLQSHHKGIGFFEGVAGAYRTDVQYNRVTVNHGMFRSIERGGGIHHAAVDIPGIGTVVVDAGDGGGDARTGQVEQGDVREGGVAVHIGLRRHIVFGTRGFVGAVEQFAVAVEEDAALFAADGENIALGHCAEACHIGLYTTEVDVEVRATRAVGHHVEAVGHGLRRGAVVLVDQTGESAVFGTLNTILQLSVQTKVDARARSGSQSYASVGFLGKFHGQGIALHNLDGEQAHALANLAQNGNGYHTVFIDRSERKAVVAARLPQALAEADAVERRTRMESEGAARAYFHFRRRERPGGTVRHYAERIEFGRTFGIAGGRPRQIERGIGFNQETGVLNEEVTRTHGIPVYCHPFILDKELTAGIHNLREVGIRVGFVAYRGVVAGEVYVRSLTYHHLKIRFNFATAQHTAQEHRYGIGAVERLRIGGADGPVHRVAGPEHFILGVLIAEHDSDSFAGTHIGSPLDGVRQREILARVGVGTYPQGGRFVIESIVVGRDIGHAVAARTVVEEFLHKRVGGGDVLRGGGRKLAVGTVLEEPAAGVAQRNAVDDEAVEHRIVGTDGVALGREFGIAAGNHIDELVGLACAETRRFNGPELVYAYVVEETTFGHVTMARGILGTAFEQLGHGRILIPVDVAQTQSTVGRLRGEEIYLAIASVDGVDKERKLAKVYVGLVLYVYRQHRIGGATIVGLHTHIVATLGQVAEEGFRMPCAATVDGIQQIVGQLAGARRDGDVGGIVGHAGDVVVNLHLMCLKRFGLLTHGKGGRIAIDTVAYHALVVGKRSQGVEAVVIEQVVLDNTVTTAYVGNGLVADAVPTDNEFAGNGFSAVHAGHGANHSPVVLAERTFLEGVDANTQRIGRVDREYEAVAHHDTFRVAVFLGLRQRVGDSELHGVDTGLCVGDTHAGRVGVGHDNAAIVAQQRRVHRPRGLIGSEESAAGHQTLEGGLFVDAYAFRTLQLNINNAGVVHFYQYRSLALATEAIGSLHRKDTGGGQRLGPGVGQSGVRNQGSIRPAIGDAARAFGGQSVQHGHVVLLDHGVGPSLHLHGTMEANSDGVADIHPVHAHAIAVEHTDNLVAVVNRIATLMVVAVPFEHAATVLLPSHTVARGNTRLVGGIYMTGGGAEVTLTQDVEGGRIEVGRVYVERERGRVNGVAEFVAQGVGHYSSTEANIVAGVEVEAGRLNLQRATRAVLNHSVATAAHLGPAVATVGTYLPHIDVGRRLVAGHIHTQQGTVAGANRIGNAIVAQGRTFIYIHFHSVYVRLATIGAVGRQEVERGGVGRYLRIEAGAAGHLTLRGSPLYGGGLVGFAEQLAVEHHLASGNHLGVGPSLHLRNLKQSHLDGLGNIAGAVQTVAGEAGMSHRIHTHRGVGRNRIAVAGGGEAAVNIPINLVTAAVHHLGVERNRRVRANRRILGTRQEHIEFELAVLLEADIQTMTQGGVALAVERAGGSGQNSLHMSVVAVLHVVVETGIGSRVAFHECTVQIPVVAQVACLERAVAHLVEVVGMGGERDAFALADGLIVAGEGQEERSVGRSRATDNQSVVGIDGIAPVHTHSRHRHRITALQVYLLVVEGRSRAEDVAARFPNIGDVAAYRTELRFHKYLGRRSAAIHNRVDYVARTERSHRVVHLEAVAAGRFVHAVNLTVRAVLVYIEDNLLVFAYNREYIAHAVAARRTVGNGAALVVDSERTVGEVERIVERGVAVVFVVEAHQNRKFLTRSHIAHRAVGQAVGRGGCIRIVIAVNVAEQLAACIVSPVHGVERRPFSLSERLYGAQRAVGLVQFHRKGVERQYRNLGAVVVVAEGVEDFRMQEIRAGGVHHTLPTERVGAVLNHGQSIERVASRRPSHEGVEDVRNIGTDSRRNGNHLVLVEEGIVVADGLVGRAFGQSVGRATGKTDYHAVGGVATEAARNMQVEDNAVRLAVFIAEDIGRMQHTRVHEITVAACAPFNLVATDAVVEQGNVLVRFDGRVGTRIGVDRKEVEANRVEIHSNGGTLITAHSLHRKRVRSARIHSINQMVERRAVVAGHHRIVEIPFYGGKSLVEHRMTAFHLKVGVHEHSAVGINASRNRRRIDADVQRIDRHHQNSGVGALHAVEATIHLPSHIAEHVIVERAVAYIIFQTDGSCVGERHRLVVDIPAIGVNHSIVGIVHHLHGYAKRVAGADSVVAAQQHRTRRLHVTAQGEESRIAGTFQTAFKRQGNHSVNRIEIYKVVGDKNRIIGVGGTSQQFSILIPSQGNGMVFVLHVAERKRISLARAGVFGQYTRRVRHNNTKGIENIDNHSVGYRTAARLVRHGGHHLTRGEQSVVYGVLVRGNGTVGLALVGNERPRSMISLIGGRIGFGTLGDAQVYRIGIANVDILAEVGLRKLVHNHIHTLKVGAGGVDGSEYTIRSRFERQIVDAAVAALCLREVANRLPSVGFGTGSADGGAVATAYKYGVGHSLQEVFRCGHTNHNLLRHGRRNIHAIVVGLGKEFHHIAVLESVVVFTERIVAVAEFKRLVVHIPRIGGLVDGRSHNPRSEHHVALMVNDADIEQLGILMVRRFWRSGAPMRIESIAAAIYKGRSRNLRGVEYRAVLDIADVIGKNFHFEHIAGHIFSERTYVDTLFVNLQRAVIQIDGIVNLAVVRHPLLAGETEHLIVGSMGRRGLHHTVAAGNNLLRNRTAVGPVARVAAAADSGQIAVAVYVVGRCNLRKANKFLHNALTFERSYLFDISVEVLARTHVDGVVIFHNIAGHGALMLGLQTGHQVAHVHRRIAVGLQLVVGNAQGIGRTDNGSVEHPSKGIILTRVFDSRHESNRRIFADGVAPCRIFVDNLRDGDFRPMHRVGLEREGVTLFGRSLDASITRKVNAIYLVARSKSAYKGVARMNIFEACVRAAVHTFHEPYIGTAVVGRRMRLEDYRLFVGTYLQALVAVDVDIGFGHLGIAYVHRLALYGTLRYAHLGRSHLGIYGGAVEHTRIGIAEQRIRAGHIIVEVPLERGLVATAYNAVGSKEMSLLGALHNIGGIAHLIAVVVDNKRRRGGGFGFHTDGVGIGASTQGVYRIDIVGERILGFHTNRVRGGLTDIQRLCGAGNFIVNGAFRPLIGIASARLNAYTQCNGGAVANQGVGRSRYRGFGRKFHTVAEEAVMAVYAIEGIDGDLGGTHLHAVRVGGVENPRHGVGFGTVEPAILHATVGTEHHGIPAAEHRIGERRNKVRLGQVDGGLESVAQGQTRGDAADRRSQTGPNAVAGTERADTQHLATLFGIGQGFTTLLYRRLEKLAVHIPVEGGSIARVERGVYGKGEEVVHAGGHSVHTDMNGNLTRRGGRNLKQIGGIGHTIVLLTDYTIEIRSLGRIRNIVRRAVAHVHKSRVGMNRPLPLILIHFGVRNRQAEYRIEANIVLADNAADVGAGINIHRIYIAVVRTAIAVNHTAEAARGIYAVAPNVILVGGVVGTNLIAATVGAVFPTIGIGAVTARSNGVTLQHHAVYFGTKRFRGTVHGIGRRRIYFNLQLRSCRVEANSVAHQGTIEIGGLGAGNVDGGVCAVERIPNHTVYGTFPLDAVAEMVVEREHERRVGTHGGVGRGDVAGNGTLVNHYARIAYQGVGSIRRTLGYIDYRNLAERGLQRQQADFGPVAHHSACGNFPNVFVDTAAALGTRRKAYAVAHADGVAVVVQGNVERLDGIQTERTTQYLHRYIVLSRTTYRIHHLEVEYRGVGETRSLHNQLRLIGIERVVGATLHPRIRIGFGAALHPRFHTQDNTLAILNAVVRTGINHRRGIRLQNHRVGGVARGRTMIFESIHLYPIGVGAGNGIVNGQNGSVGAVDGHTVPIPLQHNGNIGIRQFNLQYLRVGGAIEVEILFNLNSGADFVIHIHFLNVADERTTVAVYNPAEVARGVDAVRPRVVYAIGLVGARQIFLAVETVFPLIGVDAVAALGNHIARKSHSFRFGAEGVYRAADGIDRRSVNTNPQCRRSLVGTNAVAHQGTIVVGFGRTGNVDGSRAADERIPSHAVGGALPHDAVSLVITERETEHRIGTHGSVGRGDEAGYGTLMNHHARIANQSIGSHGRALGEVDHRNLALGGGRGQDADFILVAYHGAYRQFPNILILAATTLGKRLKAYAVAHADNVCIFIERDIERTNRIQGERSAHNRHFHIILSLATHRILHLEFEDGGVDKTRRSGRKNRGIGIDRRALAPLHPRIAIGQNTVGNRGVGAEHNALVVVYQRIHARIYLGQSIGSQNQRIVGDTRQRATVARFGTYDIGAGAYRIVLDAQRGGGIAFQSLAILKPLQANGNRSIRQYRLERLGIAGAVEGKVFVDAYVAGRIGHRGDVELIDARATAFEFHSHGNRLNTVGFARTHAIGGSGAAVGPQILNPAGNGNVDGIALTNRSVYNGNERGGTNLEVVVGGANHTIVILHGVNRINLGFFGNGHHNRIALANLHAIFQPSVGHGSILTGPDGDIGIETAFVDGRNARIDLRQNGNGYANRLAFALTASFGGRNHVLAHTERTDIAGVALGHFGGERVIAIPNDRATARRLSLERLARRIVAIDGVVAEHLGSFGRIVRIELERIPAHTARRRKHTQYIGTVGQVYKVGGIAIVGRILNRIGKRGVALGTDAYDTVAFTARRRHNRLDAREFGSRAHKYPNTHGGTLAVVLNLIEIVGIYTRHGGERHGVARVNLLGTLHIGEPTDFRLLGVRVEHEIFGQRILNAIHTRVGNRRSHRPVGIAQTYVDRIALAGIDVGYLSRIHTRAQVLEQSLRTLIHIVERIGVGSRALVSGKRDATLIATASGGMIIGVGKRGLRLNTQVYDFRRNGNNLHARSNQARGRHKGLNLFARGNVGYREEGVARLESTLAGRAAAELDAERLEGGSRNIGIQLDAGRIVDTTRRVYQRNREDYRIEHMERNGRGGVGRHTTAAHRYQTILVALFNLLHIVNREVGRIETLVFACGRLIGSQLPFAHATGAFLPYIGEVVAPCVGGDAGGTVQTRIYIRSRSRGAGGGMDVHPHVFRRGATLHRNQGNRIGGAYGRRYPNRIGFGLGAGAGHHIGLRRPVETIHTGTRGKQSYRVAGTYRSVARNGGELGRTVGPQHQGIGEDGIHNRALVGHGYGAEQTGTVVYRIAPAPVGGAALEVPHGLERLGGGIFHIPSIVLDAFHGGVGLHTYIKVFRRRAKHGVARKGGVAQHKTNHLNRDLLVYGIHTVVYGERVDRGAHGAVLHAQNRGVDRSEIGVGRRGIHRIHGPYVVIHLAAAHRLAADAEAVVLADFNILLNERARTNLAVYAQRTALAGNQHRIAGGTSVDVGTRKHIFHIGLDDARLGLEAVGNTLDARQRSPRIHHGVVGQGILVRRHKLAVQLTRGIVLNGGVLTRIHHRMLMRRRNKDVRTFRIESRTAVARVDQSLDVGAPIYRRGEGEILTACHNNAIYHPVYLALGAGSISKAELEGGVFALAKRIVGHADNGGIAILNGVDAEYGLADNHGIVGVERIAQTRGSLAAIHHATILEAVHTQVQSRGLVRRILAYMQQAGGGVLFFHPIRIGLGQRIDIQPAVALVHLPLVVGIHTRSTHLEGSLRAVADRGALGMFDNTRICVDLHVYGVFHHATPRFGKGYRIGGGGARRSVYGVFVADAVGERSARRPRIFGQLASARSPDIHVFGKVDGLVGAYRHFGQLLHVDMKRVRFLGTAIHAMDARMEHQTDAVAVAERIYLNDILRKTIEYRILVVHPYKTRFVARIHVGRRERERQALAHRNIRKILVDIGGNGHVHNFLFGGLDGDGRSFVRTVGDARQRRIYRQAQLEAVGQTIEAGRGIVSEFLQNGQTVYFPNKARRIAEAVAGEAEERTIAVAKLLRAHIGRHAVDNRIYRFGIDGLDNLGGHRQFVARSTARIDGNRVGARHLRGEVGTERILFTRRPAIGTAPIVGGVFHRVGGKEQSIFGTERIYRIDIVLIGVARHGAFGETVRLAARIHRHKQALAQGGDETVGNAAHIRPRLGKRIVDIVETVSETTQIGHRRQGLHAHGDMTVSQTAHILRRRPGLHAHGDMTVSETA